MEKLIKISFVMRMALFLLHFYFLFASLYCIMSLKVLGPIFLIIYILYIARMLVELMSKEKKYRSDLVYNVMQCGLMFYIIVIGFRINYSRIYVTSLTMNYFNINYGILCVLILFVLIYSMFELRKNR